MRCLTRRHTHTFVYSYDGTVDVSRSSTHIRIRGKPAHESPLQYPFRREDATSRLAPPDAPRLGDISRVSEPRMTTSITSPKKLSRIVVDRTSFRWGNVSTRIKIYIPEAKLIYIQVHRVGYGWEQGCWYDHWNVGKASTVACSGNCSVQPQM